MQEQAYPSWESKAERKQAALERAQRVYDLHTKFPLIESRLIEGLLEQFPYRPPSPRTTVEDIWRLAGAHDVIDALRAIQEAQMSLNDED